LHGALRRSWAKPARFNLRGQTQRYTSHDPWVEWLMMLGLNDRVDRPLTRWGEAFLPDDFDQRLVAAYCCCSSWPARTSIKM
jgi:hypothetical protein